MEIYSSDDCDGCTLKGECLYKSEENALSKRGIFYRQIRLIQTEVSFADMKHKHKIRHINHRVEEKVYKEIL